MRFRLHISYEGTRYCGWQVQKNAVSVQERVQDAVESVFGERGTVTGCSRTDSGVHANFYCCVVNVESLDVNIPAEKLPIVLNRFLPEDIAVFEACYVDEGFHPRYDVKYKEYEYLIWNSEIRNPFLRNRALVYATKLDEVVMHDAAQLFVGTHDFSGFMSSGSSVENTVRDIKYFNVSREGDLLKINVAADGFLYNMVRIFVGTLIDVAYGKLEPEDIPKIIEQKDRRAAGSTAPPHGLYLNKVEY